LLSWNTTSLLVAREGFEPPTGYEGSSTTMYPCTVMSAKKA